MFYRLGQEWLNAMMHFHAPKDLSVEEADLIVSEKIILQTPITLRLMQGSRRCDLLTDSLVAFDICSKRLIQTLTEFSGTGTFPLRLLDKDNKEISGYSGLSVRGVCGPPDWSKARPCTILKKVPTGINQPGRAGIPIDRGTWDGSDVFRPQKTRMILVTERVRKSVEALSGTNVRFTPIEAYAQFDLANCKSL